MAGQGTNRWVVLLNRSPKGPLTEEEVKTLLERGLLRANDIAYLVGDGVEKGKSEWKLLWQFPEFNRRQAETAKTETAEPETKSAAASSAKERRQKTPPEEIHQKAIAELPPDLMDISPEDLLPRSTQVAFKPEPGQITPLGDETLLQDKPDNGGSLSFDIRWVYGAGAAAMLSIAVVKLPDFFHGTVDKTVRTPTSHTDGPPPNADDHRANSSGAADRSHVQVGHGKITPPQTHTFQPGPRDPSESRYDAPAPPPAPEEERVEEPQEANNDDQPAAEPTTSTPPRKGGRPRQPTAEEENGNGPSVESEPVTSENDGSPSGVQDENGEGPRD